MEGQGHFGVLLVGNPRPVESLGIIDREPPSTVSVGSSGRGHLESELSDPTLAPLLIERVEGGNLVTRTEDSRQIGPDDLLELGDPLAPLVDPELDADRVGGVAVNIQLGATINAEGEVGNVFQVTVIDGRGRNLAEGLDIVVGTQILNDHSPRR